MTAPSSVCVKIISAGSAALITRYLVKTAGTTSQFELLGKIINRSTAQFAGTRPEKPRRTKRNCLDPTRPDMATVCILGGNRLARSPAAPAHLSYRRI